MTVSQYVENINSRYKLGNSTEHTFRGDLQQLLESLVPTIRATNEPKRQSCGAPDYILTQKDIPVGFIEAKDIGDADLEGTKKNGNKEQFDRYRESLNNIIFTDYLTFLLYREGQLITKISIGELTEKGIKPLPENFSSFENLIIDFCTHIGQTIKSSKKLAQMMAAKARLLSQVIEKALTSDETNHEDSTLKDQMEAFKQILIHDITPKGFADVYAQTIAYGLFAARLHDPTLPTFSRQEAAELIPKSNPFLRKLFGYIAGVDIDDRIKWIVDGLVEIFLACNVEEILKNYGKASKMEDPIIHFYEDFLSEYDSKLRKARGVWYTPQPVVNFIVRAVDDILKTEFGLPQGLADNSKTKIKVNKQGKQVEQEVHKVQILDPATGTGTFLAEVVKLIHRKFEGQQGIWSNYVENHLIPRLNGFELLMASYAMAHLKLDLLLTETGFKPTSNQRFRVYLTNSLEESHPDTGTLFANWLSTEANEANHIKRDTPVMCVIGNPPYSGTSFNMTDWIMNLIEEYKDENEKKRRGRRWVQDDYVKFIRFGQYLIEKNGEGILAFINPHGFLNNPTFSGMRLNLLNAFDKIYTIDLHGNSNKKETSPDGSPDVNVFDIMQGVSVNIFIKTKNKETASKNYAEVLHFDLFGKREIKYEFLSENKIESIGFQKLNPTPPHFFFTPRNIEGVSSYQNGFKIDELFVINSTGIVTAIDKLSIFESVKELENVTTQILNSTNPYLEFGINDSLQSSKEERINELRNAKSQTPTRIDYRPFDIRYMYYTKKTHGWINSPRYKIMRNLIDGNNVALMTCRQIALDKWSHVGVTKNIADDSRVSNKTKERGYIFPLFVKKDTDLQQMLSPESSDLPNFDFNIINRLADGLGLSFNVEINTQRDTFSPIDVLDYIYAVLHSPSYREKYKEFLKIDFPRVPYPKDKEAFWKLVNLGGQLRQIHLLEGPAVERYITQYPVDGNNVVTKPNFQNGRVYINDTQYFDSVPAVAWEFYIGGYQPAQKWLKDRKDRKLEFDDILHYQKIILALTETDRLMKEIDTVKFMD